MAEFSALKTEIAELVKTASSSLQYALAASGGIMVWLLSLKVSSDNERYLFEDNLIRRLTFFDGVRLIDCAFLIPFLLSLAFMTLAGVAYRRISIKAAYLKLLEGWLGAAGLGWERQFERRSRMLGWLYGASWVVLLIFDLLVALLALRIL